jgi:hypothetical protein
MTYYRGREIQQMTRPRHVPAADVTALTAVNEQSLMIGGVLACGKNIPKAGMARPYRTRTRW